MTELLQQRSPEWFAARCGSLGASSMGEMMARGKSGWLASRANLMARLVVERLTGKAVEGFVTAAMQHGIDTEDEARDAYSFHVDREVTEVGLVKHPTISGSHASPDGYVDDAGIVEIKCRQPAGHLDMLMGKLTPSAHALQATWLMACTGRNWVDLAYYNGMYPASMQLVVRRIERDDRAIAELEAQAREFLAELEEKLAALTSRYGAQVMEAA